MAKAIITGQSARRLQGTHLRSQNGGYNVGKIEEFPVILKPFAKTLIPIGYDMVRDRDVHINGFDAF